MTEAEAIKLIAEYDVAVEDCERRPNSKAAGKRFMAVMQRLIDAMVDEEAPLTYDDGLCPYCHKPKNSSLCQAAHP